MTDTAYYIIRKQILDIRHRKGINAYAKQTEMSKRYRKEVAPLLEEICRELCPPDRLVKIDTLVVELPPMTGNDYRTKWTEEVGKAFHKSLSKAIAQAPEAQNRNTEVLSKTDADIRLLTSFLYTGVLPWSYTQHQNRSPETIFRTLIKKEPEAVRRMLTEGLKQESFTKRLCYQFPVSLLTVLFDVLQSAHAENIRKTYYALHHYFEKSGHWSDAVFLLSYYSLQQLAEQPYRNEKRFTEQLLRQMSKAKNIAYRELLAKLLKAAKPEAAQRGKISFLTALKDLRKEAPAVPEKSAARQHHREENAPSETALREELNQLLREAEQFINTSGGERKLWHGNLKERLNELIRLTKHPAPEAVAKRRDLMAAIRRLFQQPGPDAETAAKAYERFKTSLEGWFEKCTRYTEQERDTVQGRDAPDTEGIYVQNAGIVIVWPFITQLFDALKFTEDRRFTSEEKQCRAVHLLQYLVSGAENSSEDRLVLNKLLCGLKLNAPIPKQLTLLQEEKEAAEALVKAAISHWPEMKNTSVGGFREAFLIREGKLIRNRNDRLLKVAQQSYDIIMDRLPWAISIVKLPWMREPLFVEW